MHFSNRHP